MSKQQPWGDALVILGFFVAVWLGGVLIYWAVQLAAPK